MSEAIQARARIVDGNGVMTPEFFRAWQATSRSLSAAPVGHLYMSGNATATEITAVGTPVKVEGSTTAGELYAFDHTAGRLTYTGAMGRTMVVSVMASLTSTSGNKVGIAVAKNGAAVSESFVTVGGGTSFVAAQTVVQLVPGDYLEPFASNESEATHINVTDLSLVAR